MSSHRIFTPGLFGKPAYPITNSMNHNFKTYHEAYRHCRHVRGLSRSLALRTSQTEFPELYATYFRAQNAGEKWTREPLDLNEEKKHRFASIIANGGKLP